MSIDRRRGRLGVLMVALAAGALLARAQVGRAEEGAASVPGAATPPVAASAPCSHGAEACAEHQKACAAARAKLDEKLAAMDKASGEAKVDAMAAVLHEMAGGPGGCAAAGCCGGPAHAGACHDGCPMEHGHGHGHGGAGAKGQGGRHGQQSE